MSPRASKKAPARRAARPQGDARARILETADRLFYKEGIRGVGVDRIVAEADVAKMTLYAHWKSKDDLLMAVLEHREQGLLAAFADGMARHTARGHDRLTAFFGALEDWFASAEFRGCAFMNAALELADPDHPGTRYVREQKRRFHAFLASLVVEAGGPAAAPLGPAIGYLVEGAIVAAVIHGKPHEAAAVARAGVSALLGRKV